MNEEITLAMNIIKQACASVTADLENHQKIQNAIVTVETALTPKPKNDEPPKK